MHNCVLNSLYLRNNNMLLLPLEIHLIVQIILFGSENYDSTANKIIISSLIEFTIKSKRFIIIIIITFF